MSLQQMIACTKEEEYGVVFFNKQLMQQFSTDSLKLCFFLKELEHTTTCLANQTALLLLVGFLRPCIPRPTLHRFVYRSLGRLSPMLGPGSVPKVSVILMPMNVFGRFLKEANP